MKERRIIKVPFLKSDTISKSGNYYPKSVIQFYLNNMNWKQSIPIIKVNTKSDKKAVTYITRENFTLEDDGVLYITLYDDAIIVLQGSHLTPTMYIEKAFTRDIPNSKTRFNEGGKKFSEINKFTITNIIAQEKEGSFEGLDTLIDFKKSKTEKV